MGKVLRDEELRVDIIVNGKKGQKALNDLAASNRKLSKSNEDLVIEQKELEKQGKTCK